MRISKFLLVLITVGVSLLSSNVYAEEQPAPVSLKLVETEYVNVYTVELKDSSGNILENDWYSLDSDSMFSYDDYWILGNSNSLNQEITGTICAENTNICDSVTGRVFMTNTFYNYSTGYKYISNNESYSFEFIELNQFDSSLANEFDTENYEFISGFGISNMIGLPYKYSEEGTLYIPATEKMKEYKKIYIYVANDSFLQQGSTWQYDIFAGQYIEGIYNDGYYAFRGIGIGRYYILGSKDSSYTLTDGNVTFKSETELNSNYTLKATDIYSNLETEELNNYNSKLNGKMLIGLFDISIMDGVNKVDIENGKYTIRVPISDEMKKYSGYYVVYIKDGAIVDTIDARVIDNKYIEFETTHLSEYGIVGEDNYVKGDINEDGSINLTDVILALRISLDFDESTDKTKLIGDLNDNGLIDLTDVILILRKSLNLDS